MDLLTSVLVPVISAGAALFAILVAADQITAGARIPPLGDISSRRIGCSALAL